LQIYRLFGSKDPINLALHRWIEAYVANTNEPNGIVVALFGAFALLRENSGAL
jgi:hypothetical protein